jgi:hypothetical protein
VLAVYFLEALGGRLVVLLLVEKEQTLIVRRSAGWSEMTTVSFLAKILRLSRLLHPPSPKPSASASSAARNAARDRTGTDAVECRPMTR